MIRYKSGIEEREQDFSFISADDVLTIEPWYASGGKLTGSRVFLKGLQDGRLIPIPPDALVQQIEHGKQVAEGIDAKQHAWLKRRFEIMRRTMIRIARSMGNMDHSKIAKPKNLKEGQHRSDCLAIAIQDACDALGVDIVNRDAQLKKLDENPFMVYEPEGGND